MWSEREKKSTDFHTLRLSLCVHHSLHWILCHTLKRTKRKCHLLECHSMTLQIDLDVYAHTHTTNNNASKNTEALFKYIHVGTHADKASTQCHCVKNSKRKKLQIYIMLYFVSVWWDGVCFCFKMVFALFSLNSSIRHSCQHTHIQKIPFQCVMYRYFLMNIHALKCV